MQLQDNECKSENDMQADKNWKMFEVFEKVLYFAHWHAMSYNPTLESLLLWWQRIDAKI